LHRLKGWDSTKIDSRHIVIHQNRDKGLFVGYVGGQHDYEAARRRLSSLDLTTFFRLAHDDDEFDGEEEPYCDHCGDWGHTEERHETTCHLCGNLKRPDGSHPYNGEEKPWGEPGDESHCPHESAPMEWKEQKHYDAQDPTKYCGEGCRQGHASDLAHGVFLHHTFSEGEGEHVTPGASSPHEEPKGRKPSGYEVRHPDKTGMGLCHYCRAPLHTDLEKSLSDIGGEHADWLLGQQHTGPTKYSRLDSRNINEDSSTVQERPHITSDGSEYTMRYAQYDAGEAKPRHQILLHHEGEQVGDMEWYGKKGTIHHVNVDEDHSRKGLATAMWMKRPPIHSADRTDHGDAWAKSVGGPRPRRYTAALMEIEALKAPGWERDHDWLPAGRIFSGGKGHLDPRVFNEQTRIMLPEVAKDTLDDVDSVLGKYGEWKNWARVYLAGSQASEWWGNNDFDCLIGINHSRIRREVPEFKDMTPDEIDKHLTNELKSALNDEEYHPPWDTDVWHRTFYCNPNSWDIRDIKPYAAYEIISQQWFVEPIHAGPDWSALKLPESLFDEGEALVKQIDAIEQSPDTQRTGRGAALWDYLHKDRGRAFSAEGSGVFDPGNAVWKYLDMHPAEPLTRLLNLKRQSLEDK
jgi:GNAT superfamily N-acetyltransferase